MLGILFSPVPPQDLPVRHEDPEEEAELVYNPISLLRFFTEIQGFLLRKDVEAVAEWLGKLPFANVPDDLRGPVSQLNAHKIKLSGLVVEVGWELEEMEKLVGEFRLDEALELGDELANRIAQAYAALSEIEGLVEATGQRTGAAFAPEESWLRQAYNEFIDRIDKTREMLDLHKGLLADLLLGVRAIEELRPTEVTLQVDPTIAFVGEEVRFWGRLSAGGEPLAGRKIDLFLDATVYESVKTCEDGVFQGVFRVPYKYVPEVVLEALYHPRGEDIGRYLASKSPPVSLRVLFYSAALTLRLEDKAFPGREIRIRGIFDYGGFLVPETRQVEIYLGGSLIYETWVGPEFSLSIELAPETRLGRRRITVAAPAMGRQAPVIASAYLEVGRATPVADLVLPWAALIPGDIELSGRVFSELGPIRTGAVNLRLGRSEVETTTMEDGSFRVTIRRGMGLELIGSQSLRVQVIPQEPWHSAVVSTESLFVVNWANSGGILLGLMVLGMLAQRRARRFAPPRGREKRSLIPPRLVEEPEPTAVAAIDALPAGEPRSRIVGWYRRIVKLLLQLFHLVFGPSQTLREFSREVSPRLGPVAGFFEELTRVVERAVYSSHNPTDEEAERGEEISRQVERRVKGIEKA
jgi:hypothetical protein